jgi:hypothetical protein
MTSQWKRGSVAFQSPSFGGFGFFTIWLYTSDPYKYVPISIVDMIGVGRTNGNVRYGLRTQSVDATPKL